jgi:hypothetical protein
LSDHHVPARGSALRVDPADGPAAQGEEGYQLTWMDAKVDDWVVTPRRGKAVEINALWYNALCCSLAGWTRLGTSRPRPRTLGPTRRAHGRRSTNGSGTGPGGYLYDVVDGEDGDDDGVPAEPAFRHRARPPVLDTRATGGRHGRGARATAHAGRVALARAGHPDYSATYSGDLRARDAAYHQGTVWGWLIGPYVDAWLQVHPDDRPVRGGCWRASRAPRRFRRRQS